MEQDSKFKADVCLAATLPSNLHPILEKFSCSIGHLDKCQNVLWVDFPRISPSPLLKSHCFDLWFIQILSRNGLFENSSENGRSPKAWYPVLVWALVHCMTFSESLHLHGSYLPCLPKPLDLVAWAISLAKKGQKFNSPDLYQLPPCPECLCSFSNVRDEQNFCFHKKIYNMPEVLYLLGKVGKQIRN